MLSTLLNCLSWVYIAYVADTICGRLFQALKSRLTKGIEINKEVKDTTNASLGEILAWDVTEPAPASVKEKNATPRDKFDDGEGWREIDSTPKTPMSSIDMTSVHSHRWREDPLIKDGYFRVDKINADGSKKTSSYYDESGKLVYQRLKEINCTPHPKEAAAPAATAASANKDTNPEFFIKPQASPSLGVEDNFDKKFTGLFESLATPPIKAAKTQIDEHVNQTFKEIFDIVRPKLF